MFSNRALEQATDLDEGLDYLFSFFPNGGLTWERDTVNSEGRNSHGVETELLWAFYTVSADGNDYTFFFADFTVNDFYDPDNVGIYGMGVTPLTESRHAGTSEPFHYWADSIRADLSDEDGYPGVYVPPDTSQLSLQKLNQVVKVLNNEDKDGSWLRALFSEYAQVEFTTELDDALEELFAFFPGRDIVRQEDPQVVPVVRESADGETALLMSTYRVSSGGADYLLFLACFTENAGNPKNVGFYAMGVAPWTASGDSTPEQALFAWADTFNVDASVPPGVLISQ